MSKKLNYNSVRLLISNFLSLGGRTVFKIFLNVYLWKETNSLQTVALFNILFLLGHGFSFIFLSPTVRNGQRRFIFTFSHLGFILTYLILFLFIDHVMSFIFYIGIFFGISNGAYYVTYNVNQFDLTTFKNRGNFEGLKKSLKVSSKIVFPPLFGLIIGLYDIKFAFIVGAFVFLLGFFVGDVKFDYASGETHFKRFISKALVNKKVLFSILGSFFFTFAFSLTLLEVLIPLLIYNEVQTEINLGFSLGFLSIISILIIYIFGKFLDYKHYNSGLVVICLLYILSLLGMIYLTTYSLLLFFSSMITALIAIYSVGVSVITSNSLHSFKNYDKYRVEFTVFKEIGYLLGWILSFLLMYFSNDLSQSGITIVFYIMIFFSIISTLFLIKINIHEIED